MKTPRLASVGGLALGLALAAPHGLASDDAAKRAGRELAAELRSLHPVEGATNLATLRLRHRGTTRALPLRVAVAVEGEHWTTRYHTEDTNASPLTLIVTMTPGGSNRYEWERDGQRTPLKPEELFAPFAGADFWPADLGMEFLHWPTQRLLRKELRRGQSCNKLESVAPPEHTNGYVRVVSWFDIDTGGPVLCEAYDARGKMVKEFKPNAFSKVGGRWQVEELEMRDLRTGSRSWIRFDLKPAATSLAETNSVPPSSP